MVCRAVDDDDNVRGSGINRGSIGGSGLGSGGIFTSGGGSGGSGFGIRQPSTGTVIRTGGNLGGGLGGGSSFIPTQRASSIVRGSGGLNGGFVQPSLGAVRTGGPGQILVGSQGSGSGILTGGGSGFSGSPSVIRAGVPSTFGSGSGIGRGSGVSVVPVGSSTVRPIIVGDSKGQAKADASGSCAPGFPCAAKTTTQTAATKDSAKSGSLSVLRVPGPNPYAKAYANAKGDDAKSATKTDVTQGAYGNTSSKSSSAAMAG